MHLLCVHHNDNSRKGSSGAARLETHAVEDTITGDSPEERHRLSKLKQKLPWNSSHGSSNTDERIAGVEESKGSDV